MTYEEAKKDLERFVKQKTTLSPAFLTVCVEALEKQIQIEETLGNGDYYVIPKGNTWTVNGIDVQEALEKQIPKPLIDGDKCPVCGRYDTTSDTGYRFPYCPDCGQAIDWSDTK